MWSDSIGLARLQALQATASADQVPAPAVRLRPTPGAARAAGVPVTAASEPFQPAYRALPAAGASAGSAVDDSESTWLEGGLAVAGAAYDLMPSVGTVASMVSIAGTLGTTATGAAELTAGASKLTRNPPLMITHNASIIHPMTMDLILTDCVWL